ncbi:MAG: hypothetical protein ACPG4Z_00240 [Chitinophagales bacterium]
MNNSQDQLKELSEIRNLMERSSRFISLSGLSGVFAGIFALIGGFAAMYKMTGNLSPISYANRYSINISTDFILFILLDAIIVLVLSLSLAVFFTTRKAKKQGLPLWDEKAFRVIINLLIPLCVGGVFCLILLYHSVTLTTIYPKMFALVAPVTLLFYGLALFNAGKYTLDEVRWLGLSEIVLGLAGCIFLGYGLLFWLFGFGVLHIFYGLLMYFKYERD